MKFRRFPRSPPHALLESQGGDKGRELFGKHLCVHEKIKGSNFQPTNNQQLPTFKVRLPCTNLQIPTSNLSPTAGLPASFTVTKQYSTPFASASRVTSAADAPFFLRKPSRALVGAPSFPKAD